MKLQLFKQDQGQGQGQGKKRRLLWTMQSGTTSVHSPAKQQEAGKPGRRRADTPRTWEAEKTERLTRLSRDGQGKSGQAGRVLVRLVAAGALVRQI